MKKIMMTVALLAGFAAATYASGSDVGQRQYNLHARIAQGRATGELNGKQARFLNAERVSIGREIHADRAANGGYLTRPERFAINQQQNQLSRQVYSAKH